ncbi:YrrS family protein [Falsibacillus albus]|uniref:DUF1510 family protein n=1 Tax=Falsibacillus albus TaxID=2478915 RepID=A0A3L7K7B2_9BACI|nr:YrrS family protein [Falsibacillus albus]RLQ98134.1 DUF1510 family protein [Falsibacillus albus]
MPNDYNSYGSRSSNRAKRRKTNIILNTLIIIVIILILIVGGKIFLGGKKDEPQEKTASTHQKQSEPQGKNNDKSSQDSSKDSADKDKKDSESQGDSDKQSKEDDQKDQSSADLGKANEVQDDSGDPNVEKTYENPDWSAVGTEQSGAHESSWDKGTVDWNEKIKAVSYATGLPQGDMTVWYVEHGSDPAKDAIATVTSKDQSKIYRVFITWEDGAGWKPTKVQQLKQNDKG